MNSIRDDIKNCLYINLEHREDRKENILRQFEEMGMPIQRFNAIRNVNGAIGCSLSHLKCLMTAKENNWDNVMIVEDDIFFLDKNLFLEKLDKFLKDEIDYDVLLLAGNNFPPYKKINENCIQVNNCQTTTGYIVKRHYYDTMINNIREGLKLLIKNPFHHRFYAIDVWWKILQRKDKWYLLTPIMAVQMSGYSDIEKRVINYTNVMLKYDK